MKRLFVLSLLAVLTIGCSKEDIPNSDLLTPKQKVIFDEICAEWTTKGDSPQTIEFTSDLQIIQNGVVIADNYIIYPGQTFDKCWTAAISTVNHHLSLTFAEGKLTITEMEDPENSFTYFRASTN